MVLRFLKDYPSEIESDLLDKGLDVGDWYQQTRDEHGRLKLSSRRLLDVVLPNLGEHSAFVTALRDGDWPDWQQMLKEIHKEIAGDNASKRGEGEFSAFLSPRERVQHYRESQEEAQARESDDETFYADMGFS
jgi:hypothetical protein